MTKLKEENLKVPIQPNKYQSPFMNKMLLLSIALPKYSSEDVDRKVFRYIFENLKKNVIHLL